MLNKQVRITIMIKRKNQSVKPARKVKAPKAVKPSIKVKAPKAVKASIEVKAPKAVKAVKVTTDNTGSLNKIMKAITVALDKGHSAKSILNALTTLDAPTNSKHAKAPKSESPVFAKVTKDFGFRLKDKFDASELKATFKETLTKAPKELGIKVGMFNKLFPSSDGELFIVAGLKKSKGEWYLTGYSAAGKKAQAPINDIPF